VARGWQEVVCSLHGYCAPPNTTKSPFCAHFVSASPVLPFPPPSKHTHTHTHTHTHAPQVKLLESKVASAQEAAAAFAQREAAWREREADLRLFVEVSKDFLQDEPDAVQLRVSEAKLRERVAELETKLQGHELQVQRPQHQARAWLYCILVLISSSSLPTLDPPMLPASLPPLPPTSQTPLCAGGIGGPPSQRSRGTRPHECSTAGGSSISCRGSFTAPPERGTDEGGEGGGVSLLSLVKGNALGRGRQRHC
jgi:hypothetical protein